jgi:hypothetical protein
VDTYFVRHTDGLEIDEATRRKLWDECRIAIHFPTDANGELGESDNASVNPDDYEGRAAGRIRALVMLAQTGGYVCADHVREPQVQVGFVPPMSSIEIVQGLWAEGTEYAGRIAVLKTIALQRVRHLDPVDSAVVLAGRPQRGTFQRWYTCRTRIADLVERSTRPIALGDLLPAEQETMCAEFLRMPEAAQLGLPHLAHLLTDVGRTMKDVDIVGISLEGKKILCQVTYHDQRAALSKLAVLQKYSHSGHCPPILFCNALTPREESGCRIVSMQQVFEIFTATASGKLWLSLVRPSR